jgi:Holliday junction DNA helicase RuvA
MIAHLSGRTLTISADSIIVEVGGVGLRVLVPNPVRDSLRPGDVVALHTHLVVRQDALTLFGFDTAEGREYFELLLSVDGIGPKSALAILSTLSPDAIRRAVFHEQAEVFTRVPGVGKRTAQKILLYLQDKLPKVEGVGQILPVSDTDSEVIEALTTLGYSVVEAQAALQFIGRDAPDDVEIRLRLALQYFSK